MNGCECVWRNMCDQKHHVCPYSSFWRESTKPTGHLFWSADKSAGYILQSERPYERWGRAAGRSSGHHCTKDPYCPNCSLLQENLLNGSCQCFLLFFSPPLARISSQQRPLYLLLSLFFFFSKVFFVFSLSLSSGLFFRVREFAEKLGGSCLHWWLDWKL